MIRQERTRSVGRAVREAERIGRVLTPDLTAALGLHVANAYRQTQDRVGVESGALKASGRSGTELRDEDETWVGYIGYGDDTRPVGYALYHRAANEPWFEGIPEAEALMAETIDAHVRKHLA